MTINNATVEQINVALLDLDKRIKALNIDNEAIKSLQNSVKTIKSSLNETKAGLQSGATYDINISGNASTATHATTATTAEVVNVAESAAEANHANSATTAESAERASKDGNGNSITSTYATKEELANTNNELNIAKKSIVPVGVIYPFGGGSDKVPDGYLPCDGRAVSRTQYSALFNVIGTSFGNGDGINTFNVPDMRNRFLEGANGNLGKRIEAGLPNITGKFYHDTNATFLLSGAFSYTRGSFRNLQNDAANSGSGYVSFDASKSNAIYGNSDTVQPPAVCVNYIIKY